jgi:DNA-binding NarL/FixJ family response regulator
MSAAKPIRVLLVDDESRLRQMAKRVLVAHHEIEVVGEAADGRTAIDLNSQLRPDLIVMDIAMPQLNGLEAAKIQRSKIIIIRAMAAEPYRKAAMDVAASAFLSEGALDSELIPTIHTMFNVQ